MEHTRSLMEHTLALFPDRIDISDGEARGDNGFWSKNLSDAWNGAEDKNGDEREDVGFMIWAIYRLLHSRSRENYLKGIYTVRPDEFSFREIEKEYREALEAADAAEAETD